MANPILSLLSAPDQHADGCDSRHDAADAGVDISENSSRGLCNQFSLRNRCANCFHRCSRLADMLLEGDKHLIRLQFHTGMGMESVILLQTQPCDPLVFF